MRAALSIQSVAGSQARSVWRCHGDGRERERREIEVVERMGGETEVGEREGEREAAVLLWSID